MINKKNLVVDYRWQTRYFSIKNDKLYWYKNQRSREAQNSLKIVDILKCETKKDLKFKIVIENFCKIKNFNLLYKNCEDKIHKLKATTTEERDKWAQIINELMEDHLHENDPLLNSKIPAEIFANVIFIIFISSLIM